MNLLAIDFSTEQRAVCVTTDAGTQALAQTSDRQAGPLGLISTALQDAGLHRDQIDAIAVGLGPGSYTGIRSAIAIAQGFQLGRDVQLCGISSAEVIARSSKLVGEFAVVIDAQRGEFYCATYRRADEDVRNTSDLRILTREQLNELDLPMIGPDVHRLLNRGDLVFPDPSELARLAQASPAFTAGHQLEPIYLRPPEFKKAPPPRQIN